MTRLIAGRLGGRRLAAPKGARTRPTTDRVREALFSRIESLMDLTGVWVLDLYAGSGALGLEALSRGAGRVVLVEADRRTADVARQNIRTLDVAGEATVLARKVETVLAEGADGGRGAEGGRGAGDACGPDGGAEDGFDLVLLDPPYPLTEDELATTLRSLVSGGWLSADALVVVERSARSPEPTWPTGLTPIRSHTYGETTVHLAEPAV